MCSALSKSLSPRSALDLFTDQLKGWQLALFFCPKGLNEILIDCTVPERPPKGVNAFSRRCRSIVLIVANSIDFPGLWCRFSAYEKSRDTFCFSHWRLEGGSWPANRMLQVCLTTEDWRIDAQSLGFRTRLRTPVRYVPDRQMDAFGGFPPRNERF